MLILNRPPTQAPLWDQLSELDYVLGVPLGAGGPMAVGRANFTRVDMALSEGIILAWANFIRTG